MVGLMQFADTHCHLDFCQFDLSRELLLLECHKASIDLIIIPSTKHGGWDKIIQLGQQFHQLQPALGLHPYFLSEHSESDLDKLDSYLKHFASSIVAVGEIGLDALVGDFPLQQFFLERQLDLASRYQLPVIFHSRKMHSQLIKSLKKFDLPGGVVHSFSGSTQELKQFVSLGLSIGVGSVITWPGSKKTRKAIQDAPLESLVLETDAPDMPVVGEAKGQSTPLNVLKVFESLCQIRLESPENLSSALWENSLRLFNKSNYTFF